MVYQSALADAISNALAILKAYDLPGICVKLGLPAGEQADAYRSKRLYVLGRIEDMSDAQLAELAERTLDVVGSTDLREELNRYREASRPRISELTRRHVLSG